MKAYPTKRSHRPCPKKKLTAMELLEIIGVKWPQVVMRYVEKIDWQVLQLLGEHVKRPQLVLGGIAATRFSLIHLFDITVEELALLRGQQGFDRQSQRIALHVKCLPVL